MRTVIPCHDSDVGEAGTAAGVNTVRVIIVDDQELFRRGLTMLLASEPDIEVVGEAGDGQAGVALAESAAPDVSESIGTRR